MFKSIYLKTLFNLRWQLLGWTLGLGFIAFITMIFYPSFSQANAANFLEAVPDSLKPLIGTVEDFKTIPGFIGQQVFGPNGYLLAIAAAIIIALSVSANEEDDKRLQTLLSLPVTRSAVFCQKWFAIITVLAVISIGLMAFTYLSLFAINETANFGRMLESTFALFLMAATFATLTFSVAMFTGKKGLSILLASGYAAASFIVTSLAASVNQLKDIEKLSVLHYYNNPLIMQHGLKAEHILVLTGIIIVIATVSWFQFRRRNIGV